MPREAAELDVATVLANGEDAAALAATLEQLGRNAFLVTLKERGWTLEQRSSLADALTKAVRAGLLTWRASLSPEFEDAAARMPGVVRQLLVENVAPSTIPADSLLAAIGRSELHAGGDVMHIPTALSPRACAALRSAVDCERRLSCDSVDRGPEHQLNLSLSVLEMLIGKEEVARLMRLPREFRRRSAVATDQRVTDHLPSLGDLREQAAALRSRAMSHKRAGDTSGAMQLLCEAKLVESDVGSREAALEADERPSEAVGDGADETDCEAGAASELREMFVRRYSVDTRPWNPFHTDAYELTANIALSPDDAHGGGVLLGVYDGQVQPILRGEGGATVHSSKLLHAVSRMTTGTRYSLILFFDRRERVGPRNRWNAT